MKPARLKTVQRHAMRNFPPTPLHRVESSRRSTAESFRPRLAIASIDMIVSMVLLVAVLSTATALCFRINRVWKDISHQRLATHELANQMDGLTRLDPREATSAIQTLQASELCARSLHNSKLSGELTEDELGVRVTLRISWEASPKPMHTELSGWLIEPKAEGTGKPSDSLNEAAEPGSAVEVGPKSKISRPDASSSISLSTTKADS